MCVLPRNAGKRKGCKMVRSVFSLFPGETKILPVSPKFELPYCSVKLLLANQELCFLSCLYLVGPRDKFSLQE